MGDRITSKWTSNTIEAFGDTPSVRLGRAGEVAVLNEVKSWPGWQALDHEESYDLQLQGIDISVKKDSWSRFYTVDIKTGNSYLDKFGNIKIDVTPDGWLFSKKKTSDRIWHVNLDTGWMAWYDRNDMKKFIEEHMSNVEGELSLPVKFKAAFIYRRKLSIIPTNDNKLEDIPF